MCKFSQYINTTGKEKYTRNTVLYKLPEFVKADSII
jgi:hypothetical protein